MVYDSTVAHNFICRSLPLWTTLNICIYWPPDWWLQSRLSQDTVKDRIKACNVFHILFSVKIGFAAFYSKIEIQVETNSNSLLENNWYKYKHHLKDSLFLHLFVNNYVHVIVYHNTMTRHASDIFTKQIPTIFGILVFLIFQYYSIHYDNSIW